jgi:hypothetical protein
MSLVQTNLAPYLQRASWRGQEIEGSCRTVDQSRFIDLALRDLVASNEFDMDWLKSDKIKENEERG